MQKDLGNRTAGTERGARSDHSFSGEYADMAIPPPYKIPEATGSARPWRRDNETIGDLLSSMMV